MLTFAMVLGLGCDIPVAYAQEIEVASELDAEEVEVATAQDAGTEETQGDIDDQGESVDFNSSLYYINLNEVKGISDRTKEAITRKFVGCVNNPDASVYSQVGSAVMPYKPYFLTESAQDTCINLANFYRYLAGFDQVGEIPDTGKYYNWENAGYG